MQWTFITTLAVFALAALVCLGIIRAIGWILEAPRRRFFKGRRRK